MAACFQHMEKLMRPAFMFARCVSLTAAIKLSFGEIHMCIVQPAVANYSQQRQSVSPVARAVILAAAGPLLCEANSSHSRYEWPF